MLTSTPEVNPIPPLVLPFNVPVQLDILDLADVFDASASSFGLMGVDPPGVINVSLDGSNLEVSGISGAGLGTYRLRIWASDGTMQSFYTVTIFINAPRLYVDRGAPPGGDGSTWASALVSLQDAIALAADPAVDDEIWVSHGAYFPDEGAGQVADHVDSTFRLPPGLRIFGGFAGGEESPDERDLRGQVSILSGDLTQDDLDLDGNGIAEEPGELAGTNAKHVVTIDSPETRVVLLDGFAISAGRAEGGADETQRGGAIYCLAGALELVHCQLSGNSAQKLGGAIYSAGDLELANCSIRGNSTLMHGGGIYAESAIDLTNCVISGNKSGGGGGIYLFTSPSASLVNCTLAGNSSYSNGGALASHASTIAMANTVIWNNVARTPGRTSYPDASFSGSVPTFFHCLVENHELGSDRFNLDGTDPDKAPLFFATPDPFSAPHSTGDPQVPSNSPLVGAGSNLANPTELDIAGNSRISQGTIDIGAFEATAAGSDLPATGTLFPDRHPEPAWSRRPSDSIRRLGEVVRRRESFPGGALRRVDRRDNARNRKHRRPFARPHPDHRRGIDRFRHPNLLRH